MSYAVTLVGLDVVGLSLGLALGARRELRRLGHDRDPKRAQAAQRQGAVDKVEYNLPQAVEKAQLVLLTEPLAELEQTFAVIGPALAPGAVVMDFAPLKRAPAEWATRHLPASAHYIGLTPAFNPLVLAEGEWKPRADLFANGLIAIAAPPNTPAEALQLAEDLVQLLGARALFSDASEIDGLMTTARLLPTLAAAALLRTAFSQPGWREARKFAGGAYRSFLAILSAEAGLHLGDESLLNQANVALALDKLFEALLELREYIVAEKKEALQGLLAEMTNAGAQWWEERQLGLWDMPRASLDEVPSFGERLSQSFLGTRKRTG